MIGGYMSSSYNVTVGQRLRIEVPCMLEKGYGEYPLIRPDLVLGWAMTNPTVGSLEVDTSGNGCAVIYTHASATTGNMLIFTAVDGRSDYVNLMVSSSTIHDHSELAQGGPAFGTYASLLDEET